MDDLGVPYFKNTPHTYIYIVQLLVSCTKLVITIVTVAVVCNIAHEMGQASNPIVDISGTIICWLVI
jgi:hypothetical protein